MQFMCSGSRHSWLEKTESRLDQLRAGGGCRETEAAECGIEANSIVAIYSLKNAAQSEAGVCAESAGVKQLER